MSVPRPWDSARGGTPGECSPRATVRRLAGPRVVVHRPVFAAVGGSINAGLFLAQLFHWHDKGSDPDGWIYKTQAEWEEETGLSRWEQETARELLRERGLVEEKLAGLPARLYYRLDVERLIALLSARVRRTARRPGEDGDGRRPRAAVEPAATSRTSARDRHNQDCGSATNKDVGEPQTSSRVCRTHAENTYIDYSREHRTERLPAGSLADSDESVRSSSSGPDEPTSEPSEEAYPSETLCSLHGVPMRLRRKDGDRWYSHRLRDGSWCRGAPGDQVDSGPDPQSIEYRWEYLGWVDPDAHRRLPGAPLPADYGPYRGGAAPRRSAGRAPPTPATPPPDDACDAAESVDGVVDPHPDRAADRVASAPPPGDAQRAPHRTVTVKRQLEMDIGDN